MTSHDAPDLNAITQTINIARHTAFMNPGMLWAREMERVCGGALDVIAALRAAETKLAAIQDYVFIRSDITAREVGLILNGKGDPS